MPKPTRSTDSAVYQSLPTPSSQPQPQSRGSSIMDPRSGDADRSALLSPASDTDSNVGSYSRPFRQPSPNVSHSNIVQPGKGTSTMHSYSTASQSTNSNGGPAPRFMGSVRGTSASDISVHSSSQFSSASSGEKAAFARRAAMIGPADYEPEEDDWLHEPGSKHNNRSQQAANSAASMRGILNVGTLLLILACLLMLFLGYPVIIEIRKQHADGTASTSLSTTNTYTTFPMEMKRGLIDQQTPAAAYNRASPVDDSKWHLVFSDEFNIPGRTFWPGEDPYWQGFNGWYSGTNDYEYYTPEAINTTDDGYLQISFEERLTHNLNFRSGMLQSWNKACFTGGYMEIRAQLPGSSHVAGYWPGLWLMGNLGRPGYNGANEGIWPYSYAGCDTGSLPNQTWVNGTGPAHATYANGAFSYQVNHKLSYLPGLRFPACTCPGEDHPGPNNNVARSSPELDMLEATIGGTGGMSSQSLQVAPFDIDYFYNNRSGTDYIIHDADTTEINTYHGNELQESVSALSQIPSRGYQRSPNADFVNFAVEWEPDMTGNGLGINGEPAYITWYIDDKPTWTLHASALTGVPELDISRRLIPREPMSIILNVGMAYNFQPPMWSDLEFPGTMKVDYVRMYQRDGRPDRVSCSPKEFPTREYIERHADVYQNNNISRFPKDRIPKNRMTHPGC
ncbi:hypothetical protein NDA11_001892 [Ustilago hordei]|uniref:Related to KRE6-Beta-glucan synthase subunit n=1 Tax=Ustilago hordei TaxID=120017 RepID=I2FR40_USTHO|nr:uncharacterized protein UHO2_05523 [Ustilago hordei]KAJ1042647.1 hypothetical protein NDA10_001460 [Ustilago hordei]KAJ1572853.1 hypothetical protein NDA15_006235 [Ustilago hordei]KAJ1575168.1 hypothetical protein NDA11_001892 [Ustilago hordei]KAJ1575699.1 hypothetical protein NDA12_002780 [Ustilago hordei]KAJ1598175.1 hypothetical protein NDA14_006887 [Ustilago hordei]